MLADTKGCPYYELMNHAETDDCLYFIYKYLNQDKSRDLVGDVAAVKCAVVGLPGFLKPAAPGGLHFICESFEPSTSVNACADETGVFGFIELSTLPPVVPSSLAPVCSGVSPGNPEGGVGGSLFGFPVSCPYTAIAWK